MKVLVIPDFRQKSSRVNKYVTLVQGLPEKQVCKPEPLEK